MASIVAGSSSRIFFPSWLTNPPPLLTAKVIHGIGPFRTHTPKLRVLDGAKSGSSGVFPSASFVSCFATCTKRSQLQALLAFAGG